MSETTQSASGGKTYHINAIPYQLKERYSTKDWGKIISIIGGMNYENNIASLVALFDGDALNNLLSVIFTKPLATEIYEDDFEEASAAINDFFTRKNSLMKNIQSSSANSNLN